ncbi:MAG: phosphoribosylformylglycinamidine cyclo-ligase [bacterium]|jgi:phosphoribosylformylglycinamidine cyclo-ligase
MSQSSKYTQAGVDIDAGDRVKKQIAEMTRRTFTPRVLHREGAFGALFSITDLQMNKPVLVSSVDGVGTKIKVAVAYGRHRGIGADIVNHCIDDILTSGAKPLFFLDYFACGKQHDDVVLQLIDGMSSACQEAGISLIGGETAQMPDVYEADDYDVAGTIVGVVDEESIIDGRRIQPGDVLVGFPSSGLHTNGYTLARKVLLEEAALSLDSQPEGLPQPLGDELLTPHRSYLREVETLKSRIDIKGIAHITGGGFEGNICRILPDGCAARVDTRTWQPLPIFNLIQQKGAVASGEMYRVFNMGIGLILMVSPGDAERIRQSYPETAIVGDIIAGAGVELVL